MTRKRPDYSFLDDEGDVYVSISEAGLHWLGDSHNPNWGGGYGIGRQRFDEYLTDGPMTTTPPDVEAAIEARVRELMSEGYAGVALWTPSEVRRVLGSGEGLSGLDQDGRTPLHSTGDHFAAALLEAGADPHARNPRTGETPLHDAAYNSSREKIRLLLAAGADLEALDDEGRTPLMRALANVSRGDREMRLSTLRLLVEAGADRERKLPDGTSVDEFL